MSTKTSIPLAIIIAGALIAGAFYFSRADSTTPKAPQNEDQPIDIAAELRPVNENDHILGNPNARIVFIEYSDTECPYCKVFHATMHRVMEEFGKNGDVAWVYRQFPLVQLHPKAVKESEATECAAELGGNDAFWEYIDMVYEKTPSNNGLDLSLLPDFAEDIGLDRGAFLACLNSGKHLDRIQKDFEEAVAVGGEGTPHSVILIDGQAYALPGAQTFETLSSIITSAKSQNGGLTPPTGAQ